MKLIDLLTTGKQIRTLSKSEIPGLLGEIETMKARLWVRLTEWEELEPILVFAKTASERMQTVEKSSEQTQRDSTPGPQGRILRTKEVVRMVGLSRSTIWNLDRDGKFPKHRSIGPRSVGWLDTDVHEWIAERFGNGDKISSGSTRSLGNSVKDACQAIAKEYGRKP